MKTFLMGPIRAVCERMILPRERRPDVAVVQTHAHSILAELTKREDCRDFVSAESCPYATLPAFQDAIKHPLFLSSVEGQVDAAQYRTTADFAQDLHRVFEDCVRFHKRSDPEYARAQTIWAHAASLLATLPEPHAVDLSFLEQRDPVRTVFVMIGKNEYTARKACYVPSMLTRKLARRMGKQPKWWPDKSWYKNSRQEPRPKSKIPILLFYLSVFMYNSSTYLCVYIWICPFPTRRSILQTHRTYSSQRKSQRRRSQSSLPPKRRSSPLSPKLPTPNRPRQ